MRSTYALPPYHDPKIDPVTNPQFSYYYQDDIPSPGNPPQTGNPTDGGSSPPGYPHRLGDIFHSEAIVVEPPRYFQYLSGNLTPTGTTTPQPYLDFSARHAKRRRVIYVGSNDGFLHAFDAGVFNGDTTNLPGSFDLGSGREIFAYTPRAAFAGGKFQSLLNFSPQSQYFVDGSMAHADVFVDPEFDGASGPDPTLRVWRTVLVGGLRQGGSGYYALDVTQPDDIDENTANSTYGEMTGPKTSAPKCLDGSGSSCKAGATSNRPYPAVMWEFADPPTSGTIAPCSDGCGSGPGGLSAPALGETWSRPVIGRVKVITDPVLNTFEDRYVAFFGGGFDPSLDVADDPVDTTVGRAFYMVDVETGKILFKTSEGVDGNGNVVSFGPMPAPPAAADYNDDGCIDVVYIGDTRGHMWRIDVTRTAPRRAACSTRATDSSTATCPSSCSTRAAT
jgi:type IV pilus assembly protein PilY1